MVPSGRLACGQVQRQASVLEPDIDQLSSVLAHVSHSRNCAQQDCAQNKRSQCPTGRSRADALTPSTPAISFPLSIPLWTQVLTEPHFKGFAIVFNVPIGPKDDPKKWELLFKQAFMEDGYTPWTNGVWVFFDGVNLALQDKAEDGIYSANQRDEYKIAKGWLMPCMNFHHAVRMRNKAISICGTPGVDINLSSDYVKDDDPVVYIITIKSGDGSKIEGFDKSGVVLDTGGKRSLDTFSAVFNKHDFVLQSVTWAASLGGGDANYYLKVGGDAADAELILSNLEIAHVKVPAQ